MTALNVNAPAGEHALDVRELFSVSQASLIRQSCIDIGAIDPQENLTAAEYADCSFKANLMVKTWMGNSA